MKPVRTLLAALAFASCAAPVLAADTSSVATLPKPVAAGTPWTSSEIERLRAKLDAILANARTLRGAHVGLLALETKTQRVLYARAPDDVFVPASNFKVLTGSAAMAKLGPAFTFKTAVGAVPILDSASSAAVAYRLVLVGGGDALLRAADLDAAAVAVASSGLGPIAELAADTSYFDQEPYEPGWSWDDFPFYYAPVVSALCLEDNVVHMTVTAGPSPGAIPAFALVPPVTLPILDRAITGTAQSKVTVDVDRAGAQVVLTGSIPAGAKPEKIDAAVPDPEQYALEVFAQALAAHGVSVTASTPGPSSTKPPATPYRMVWTHESPPLARYLADFWYPSDNLVGEVLLKSLGVARAGVPGTAENGAALERDWLRSLGVDPARVDISDGSGLSVYDRISPSALVRILQYDWNGANRDIILDALPVAGVRGSTRDDFKRTPAEGRVFAKTGTVRHARALSGYLRPLRHGAITFSLMVDDWMGEDAEIQAVRARVLSALIVE